MDDDSAIEEPTGRAFEQPIPLRIDPDPGPDSDSEMDAVTKIGHAPTLPRTLHKQIGLIGVNSSVVCPWPNFYLVATFNLGNGGSLGLLIGTIIACVGMTPVYLSLAEKMRKYPTAGGQYHWVAALAPKRSRKFLSFLCCCILTFTWLTFLGAGAWLFGLDITAIVLLYTGKYHVWQSFVCAMSVMVVAYVVNITWGKHMNIPETLVLVLHLAAFLVLAGILSFAIGTNTVSSNLTISTDGTGWSPGFGVLLSILYATNSLVGFDAVSHIAEDTADASRRIPRSLLYSTTGNKILCIILAILIALSAGNVNDLFEGPYGQSGHPVGSIVQLTFNATRGNKALASAPFGMMAPLILMCCINCTAAASRMVFSFVRDDRNPFFQWLMASDLEQKQVPRGAIALTVITPAMWLWLNFVSATGFLAIGSQVTLSLATTYMFVLGCSLYSRICNPDVLGRQQKDLFHYGRLCGSITDISGLCFLALIFVLAWFPYSTPATASTINYAGIMMSGIAFLGVIYYFTYSRNHYHTPAPSASYPGIDLARMSSRR